MQKTDSTVGRPRKKNIRWHQTALLLASLSAVSMAAFNEAAAVEILEASASFSDEMRVGVGTVVCGLSPADVEIHQTGGLTIRDAGQRVCFPAWSEPLVGRAFGLLTGGGNSGKRMRVHFLFTGDGPLRLQISATETSHRTVAVNRKGHRRSLNQWWRAYQAQAQARRSHEGLAYLDTFLVHTLSRQLGLQPTARHANTGWKPHQAVELLTGSKGLRKQALVEVVAGVTPESSADLPLPPPIAWQTLAVPEPKHKLDAIEGIAHHIPHDCIYVRFGSFSNYLWLTKTAEARAADITMLTAPISSKNRQNELIQQQLGIKELPYAEMFGDKVIDDIAIVAKDLFLGEGAAFGVVFQSSSRLMSTGMSQVRKAVCKENGARNATLKDIRIHGTSVSFMSTPDHHVRSFYVQRGDYHLITNCRAIVESFVAIENGRGSLARDPEFRYAREQLVQNRKDSGEDVDGAVFAFVPRHCLETITSPAYQIELWRRTRSIAEMQAFQLAKHFAEHQRQLQWPLPLAGGRNGILSRIIDQGILPNSFQQHAGSGVLLANKTGLIDTIRGKPGTFLPIPDALVTAVTATEVRRYEEFANYLLEKTPTLPPIALTLQRMTTASGSARLAFRVHVAPFDRTKYEFLRFFVGDPSREFLVPGPNALASLSILSHDFTGRAGGGDDLSLVTLVNQPMDHAAAARSLIRELGKYKAYPVYCVSTLSVRRFPIIGAMVDESAQIVDGLQRLPLGLWRKPGIDLTAISFQPELLRSLPAEFHTQLAKEPSHIRLRVGNLAASELAVPILEGIATTSTRRSQQNALLLNALSQHLNSPPSDSWEIAHDLLGAAVRCPLGGTYQLDDHVPPRWISDAWNVPSPDSKQANPIAWLKSVDVNVGFHSNRITGHGQIELQPDKKPANDEKSIFDLFRKS